METQMVAAESWLSVAGKVAGWQQHLARFAAACAPHGVPAAQAQASMWAARDATPKGGEFFPLVSLRDGGLSFVIRPAPERLRTVRLATAKYDPRTQPGVKGPDLEALGRLRQAVAKSSINNANEAVILSADGYIVEGAYSALCWWWRGQLFAPDVTLTRVDSVTFRLLRQIAAGQRVSVQPAFAKPEQLIGCEVWALSALHGIRIAESWDGGAPLFFADPRLTGTRINKWQKLYEHLRA